MIEKQVATLKTEEEERIKEIRTQDQKYVLLPILDALGIPRKSWEKFRFAPDQIVGLIISSIKQSEQTQNRLVRRNINLVQEKEKRGQMVLDFMKKVGNAGGKS